MKHALFLEPLPERSSIPDSQQSRDSDHTLSSGIFTLATVPELLVARRPLSEAFTESRDVDGTVEGSRFSSRARHADSKAVLGTGDEVCKILLHDSFCRQAVGCPMTRPVSIEQDAMRSSFVGCAELACRFACFAGHA